MNDMFYGKIRSYIVLIFLWLPTKMHDGKWRWMIKAHKEITEYVFLPLPNDEYSKIIKYYTKEDIMIKILTT
jgi:hypothetical protein